MKKNSFLLLLEKKADLLAFIIYAIATFVLILYHEPWYDELHSWLVSRELSFFGIIYQMRYDGYFALWSHILLPFASFGFPVITMNIISWLLSVEAAWILLFKSPFHRIVKYSLLLSAAFIYWFPVVARAYALIPLILFILAYLHSQQDKKPLWYAFFIGLLAHTHAYMEGMVGILFVFYAWDNILNPWKTLNTNKRIISMSGAAIILLMVLLAFLQVYPAFEYSHVAKIHTYESLKSILYELYERLHYGLIYPYSGSLQPGTTLEFLRNTTFGKIFIFLLLLFVVVIFYYSKRQFIIFAVALGWQLLFALFIYQMGNQRTYLFFYLLIFACWIILLSADKNVRKNSIISFFLILFSFLSYGNTFNSVIHDINEDFSSEQKIANFINNNVPKGETIYFANYRNITINAYAPDYTYRYMYTLDSVEFEHYGKHRWKEPDFIGNIGTNAFILNKKNYYYAVFDFPIDSNQIKKETNNKISFKLLYHAAGYYYFSDRYVFKVKKIY